MKDSAQVVVIGGGVVGASVLYHLTRKGWTDVVLLERKELTAGSTWHAAGGMHTLNGDPNVASLQQYTVNLYEQIEKESGVDCGIHLTGGVTLASDADRLDWLKMAVARGRYMGMNLEMISVDEAHALFPLMDPKYFVGAMWDPEEGNVDPTGITNAYATCARNAGADVHRHTWVKALDQRPDGTWTVTAEVAPRPGGNRQTHDHVIHAEHVVNAGGLWAREVGRMTGLELPVLAMQHHYLVTEPMAEVVELEAHTGRELPVVMDFKGEIYVRQEGDGMLLGTYEQDSRHWSPVQTPWDFEMQLLDNDLDRISPELTVAFQHYPAMAEAGIKSVINGPFTFSPDGNPLVGPVRGLRNYWSACAVMAGLSQGGGVGLALANWMVDGDPGFDIWAMDVARFGDYATLAYTNAKVHENYRRRFRITFPNEELPAGRPLLTTPLFDRFTEANAVWGAAFGLENPLWFQAPGLEPIEEVTFRRSNAFERVGVEARAVRDSVGLTDITNFAKYRVSGPGAGAWLQGLITNRLPKPGRITLTAVLNPQGRIVGEFTVAAVSDIEYMIFGSLPAQVHHARWFESHLPTRGDHSPQASVSFEVLGLGLNGLGLAGPRSRHVLAAVTGDSVANDDFRFMDFRSMNVAMAPCRVGRLSYTGELGYEIWCAPEYSRHVFDALLEAGRQYGLKLFGLRALLSLRMEKMFGSWFREYRPIFTPIEAGIEHYVKLDHDFIGRNAYEGAKAAEAAGQTVGTGKRLAYFEVDPDPDDPADVIGDEPIWRLDRVVGWVTSGDYSHCTGRSLALGYVDRDLARPGTDDFEIEIIGQRRPARLLTDPVVDPGGERMRS
jgi:dimethylglycine dehydrogenase